MHRDSSSTAKAGEREEHIVMVPFTEWSRNKVWVVKNLGSDFTSTKAAAQTLL